MAETYNGGKWDDPDYYTTQQQDVHRRRAAEAIKILNKGDPGSYERMFPDDPQ
jgi:hypothetical protein